MWNGITQAPSVVLSPEIPINLIRFSGKYSVSGFSDSILRIVEKEPESTTSFSTPFIAFSHLILMKICSPCRPESLIVGTYSFSLLVCIGSSALDSEHCGCVGMFVAFVLCNKAPGVNSVKAFGVCVLLEKLFARDFDAVAFDSV